MNRITFLLVSFLCISDWLRASTVIESGNFTGLNPGLGASAVTSAQYMGWRFTLPTETLITSFGGTLFLNSGTGTLFGVIVAVDDLAAFPAPPLTIAPLVSALLNPPAGYFAGSLTTVAVSADLPAGTYALIFGGGAFGASGFGGIANIASTPSPSNVMLVGNTSLNTWTNFNNGDYFFVAGDPVPEPATASLLVIALMAGSYFSRKVSISRKQNAVLAKNANAEASAGERHVRQRTLFM